MNLVTGATGIIGSHVVLHLLREGKPVIACRQKRSDVGKLRRLFAYYGQESLLEGLQWREIDLADVFSIEEAVRGVTNVYHCAGLVSFLNRDREKLFLVNEKGTANLVTACLQEKVKALCHVSSIATINNLDHRSELDETVFWKKSGRESDYAISKYNSEREAWRGSEEGLKVVIVNPGVVLSPGFWDQSSSRLFKVCYEGNSFYTEGLAAYVSGEDTAKCMVQLMEGCHYANRYIISAGDKSFKEVLDMICAGLNKKGPTIRASRFLLQLGRFWDSISAPFSGREKRITKALINSAFNHQTYSNSKIKAVINIDFTPIQASINSICAQYLAEVSKTPIK